MTKDHSQGVGQTWLYDWMDEFDINNLNDVERSLRSPTVIKRLYDLAEEESLGSSHEIADLDAVVVGRSLDFTGPFGCERFDCQTSRLNKALLGTWHSFDRIVMCSPEPNQAMGIIDSNSDSRVEALMDWTSKRVQTLLYLRDIGADKHIYFRWKGDTCPNCVRKIARSLQLRAATSKKTRDEIVRELNKQAVVEFRNTGQPAGIHYYKVRHPILPDDFFGWLENEEQTTHAALIDFVLQASRHFAVDHQLSSSAKLPLFHEIQSFLLGASAAKTPSEHDIALQLKLPSLRGVESADLIRLMEDEKPELERFRSALRGAIREKIGLAGDRDPNIIAKEIERDYIRPALADIDSRLAVAKRTLAKKSSAGVIIGSALLTTGLLTAMPLVVGAGVTALASPMLDAKKFLDDKANIETADMYFLWKNMQQGE